MKQLSINFHMSLAFHPQADGRSERTNKTVGQILQTFTSKKQSKWLEALPAVEFAINFATKVVTGFTPFKLIFGQKPQLFSEDPGPPTGLMSLTKWFNLRKAKWAEARDALWTSRVKQALQHNRRQKNRPQLTEGDWALLDNADWQGQHQKGTDKLKEKFEGTARKLDSDGTIRVNIGCSHPRETRMEANRVIPSTDVKSVKGIQVELGISIDQGKCIPRLHPTNLWLGASH
jgi:hypothetical protein